MRDNEALKEAASSPSRSSSSSSNNSSSLYVGSSSSGSSEAEVSRGRVESRHTRAKAAAARVKAAADSSGASGGSSGGASRGPDEGDSEVCSEEVTHQLRPAGTPGRFSDLEKAHAVAARSSPGGEEGEDSRTEEQLGREDVDAKSHQATLGIGESAHLDLNDSSLSQQSVDLQTVDRLHVSDDVTGGGDAVNAHSKRLNSTVGLSSIGVMPAIVLQPSRNDIHKSGQPLAVEAESATILLRLL